MDGLSSSFLPTAVAPVLSSTSQFLVRSHAAWRQSSSLISAGLCATMRTTCDTGRQEARPLKSDCVTTRRQILSLARKVLAGVGAAVIMPSFALAAEKATTYSNIDDARSAGEKLREMKEAADGPVKISSSGIKYRELERGVGKPIVPGDSVSIYYTISRLNGYYLDSLGYGKEGKNDVGETLDFQYNRGMVPEAIDGGMEGMQVGAKRRILVTPDRGWVTPNLLPQPTSFFAERRLSERRATQALLIEVELVKAKPAN